MTASLSAEYLLNRSLALAATYTYTDFNRTGNNDDYNENEVLVGLRVRR
ncbi:MAG: outer membrane beta-barrel protein [Methyloligellaceae bacterium]